MKIVQFEPSHLESAVQCIKRASEVDGRYPYNIDKSEEFLSAWLTDSQGAQQWVMTDTDNNVIGHIQIQEPHDYITSWSSRMSNHYEISKFFIHPSHQGRTMAAELFRHARKAIRSLNKTAVLVSVGESSRALAFYEKMDMLCIGVFNGFDGQNFVFESTLADLSKAELISVG